MLDRHGGVYYYEGLFITKRSYLKPLTMTICFRLNGKPMKNLFKKEVSLLLGIMKSMILFLFQVYKIKYSFHSCICSLTAKLMPEYTRHEIKSQELQKKPHMYA